MLYELDAVAFPATSFAFSSPPCFYMFFNDDDDGDRYVAAGEHILFLTFKDNAEERIGELVQRVSQETSRQSYTSAHAADRTRNHQPSFFRSLPHP
jgi:hypothetical protein